MELISVIGGSGFIGSRLVSRLNLNSLNQVRILDKVISSDFPNQSLQVNVCSVNDLRSSLVNCESIINLAAEHRDDVVPVSLYEKVNVQGAENVCLVAREIGINTIVFTSSVAVYGFAPIGTSESGRIAPFNEYGRTKWLAEKIYETWQKEDPLNRRLIIVRPTVVFGERNRGNVYNLLKQITSGRFMMIGNGFNRKSMAYVENVAAFLEYSLTFKAGIHVYNYIDKPDFSMNELVDFVNKILKRSNYTKIKLPIVLGIIIGKFFDIVSKVLGKKFLISEIRIKKFCTDSIYDSSMLSTGFIPPIKLLDALQKTIEFEFIEDNKFENLFYSE